MKRNLRLIGSIFLAAFADIRPMAYSMALTNARLAQDRLRLGWAGLTAHTHRRSTTVPSGKASRIKPLKPIESKRKHVRD